MIPTITAFERSPDGGVGLARDMRVRWALEEVGQPYAATHRPGLLPVDADARARAIAWLFAALNTVEPPIVEREQAPFTDRGKPWYEARLAQLDERIRTRLDALVTRLGDADWLDGDFSAGDLMMVMVLRRLEGMDILETYSTLAAYVARGTARPAYRRAYAAQRAVATS